MTRKDYVLIADAIAQTLSECPEFQQRQGARQLAYKIIDILADDNERFDRDKFNRAANL